MASPSPFGSPAKRPSAPRTVSTESDPLISGSPDSAVSFKKRAAAGPSRPGLLGGLISSATIRPSNSSPSRRADMGGVADRRAAPGPGRIALPTSTGPDEEEEGMRTPLAGSPREPGGRYGAGFGGRGMYSNGTPMSESSAPGRKGWLDRIRGSGSKRADVASPSDSRPYASPLIGRPGPMSPGGGGAPPPIPAALPLITPPADATPLPKLPLVCLCFAMIAEFLSASVAGPFIFFFLGDLGVGQGPDGGGDATIGFWAGIVSSVFFLSQFFTSLLWASLAAKHGRRAVLFVSLLGNGLSLLTFGSSTTVGMMICARLAQGVFNGAIGVARGAVRDITDPTNESRAISFMGLCWGMGGIVGPILGGLLEHPVENHPWLFGNNDFLREKPYILPCMVAACVCATGAFLCLFLGWDGGLRSGAIHLPTEKPSEAVPMPSTTTASGTAGPATLSAIPETDPELGSLAGFRSRLGSRVSAYFGREGSPRRGPISLRGPSVRQGSMAMGRTPGMQSVLGVGSAYGYEPRGRRFASRTGGRRVSLAPSMARSVGGETQYAPDYEDVGHSPQPLNFAQRLLLANEDAVFGLHDVWVAAATTQEVEGDEYSQADVSAADWQGSVFEDDEDSRVEQSDTGSIVVQSDDEDDRDVSVGGGGFGYDGSEPPSTENLRARALHQQQSSLMPPGSYRDSPLRRARTGSRAQRSSFNQPPPSTSGAYGPPGSRHDPRRPSMASVRPALFNNTGLRTPPLMSPALTAEQPFFEQGTGTASAGFGQAPTLAAIPETRPVSTYEAEGGRAADASMEKPPPSLFAQLPLALIAHYAVLAFHGTTCDQVFMSFLVTEVRSGGLGLSASHYAELIAAMCVAQMIFQFQFYPKIGPPRGKLSHVAMFRLGLALYVPVYLLLPELRGLLREDHTALVMFGMILLSTFRWLANVCAYTAVMVLVNAMTPPHLISLANGLAQCAVSAARFVGPLVGGTVWSFSITPSPDARPYPFNNALGFFVIACICSLGFLMSFRLR